MWAVSESHDWRGVALPMAQGLLLCSGIGLHQSPDAGSGLPLVRERSNKSEEA